MNQHIIQDFWNLPGVLGVALIHEEAEPYFYVKEQITGWEKQGIIQVILQVLANKKERFDLFEFKVMGYHAYTYKLNPYLTLIVLTPSDIVAIKLQSKQLKAALQENIESAITTFELLKNSKNAQLYALGANNNAPLEEKVTIEELLDALNALSRFNSNYMGSKLTANYWQLTRPKFKWLDNFQINNSAKIAFSGAIAEPVSAAQQMWVQEWTAAFIKQCSQIIQDLPTMIQQKGLDERKKRLILASPASERIS